MAQEKAFIVKLESGEEIGPMDQEALIKHAENGTVTAGAQVRSTLLPLWMRATEVDCIKKLLRSRQQHLAEAAAQSKWSRLKAQIGLRGDYDPLSTAISQEGLTYHKSAFLVRILAAVIDLAVIGLAAVVAMMLCEGLQCAGVLATGVSSFYLFVLLSWLAGAFYFMYTLNRSGQTWGMRFWGLVALTADFTPVYLGRATAFFLCWMLLGWLSPLAYLFSGCRATLQELCTGLRIRRIVVARKQY